MTRPGPESTGQVSLRHSPAPPHASLHQASSKRASWRRSLAVCSLGTLLSSRAFPPAGSPKLVLHLSKMQTEVLTGRRGMTHPSSCPLLPFLTQVKEGVPLPYPSFSPQTGPPSSLCTQSSFWYIPHSWAQACHPAQSEPHGGPS